MYTVLAGAFRRSHETPLQRNLRNRFCAAIGRSGRVHCAAASQAQTQQQPQAQPQQQPAATDPSQQPQTQDQTATSDEDDTVKGVKPGSEKDVNSVGNRGVGKGVNLYSLQREIALGKQAAMEVEKTAKMINDPVVTEYVNRVGQNLVRNSDAKVPFTIKVIDSDEINAFALPGGFFYVNSGLILRADEEAELAGVMGHEIAHVAARHGTKTATKGEIMQLATIPSDPAGPGGWAGYGIYEGLNLAIPMSYLKFTRDAEKRSGLPRPPVHVQGRVRSERVRELL